MKSPAPIETTALATVTGGIRQGGCTTSGIDGLISQLNAMTSSIQDINKKTSGFGSTEMLVLCMLAMQQQQAPGVVYVGRPRFWW